MTTKTLDRTRPPAAGHRRPPGFISRWRARRAEREQWAAHHRLAQGITAEFREACTALRLCQYVSVAAGITVRTPRVGAVHGGPPITLTVELMAGQEPADFISKENGPRLAHSLGGHGLRVEPMPGRWVRLVVLNHDPLRDGFALPALTVASGSEPVILGRTEDGITLGHAIADASHIAVQGQNGSGKSAFTYALLSQLAAADDVLVCGSDITGLVLGPAWYDTPHAVHQMTNLDDLEEHANFLEELVLVMEARLGEIPPRQDKITPRPDCPTLLVVLEEFPGLLRAADARPKPKRGEGTPMGDRIRSCVLRLLSEGRKAAIRVLMLAQRFEATAVGGGYARDQFALRLSFRVPADSLEMLHGTDARALGPEHANAAPGIAYLSGLGRDCERIRVPYLGEYGEYVDRVQAYARRAER
ncbi:hypothetical protein ACFPK1_29305 [Actinomycetospora rhizophila]|uniref:FtsK domain-containing protein n=1 Tax=Actinomycetospora rhizophila TaxID=1416876 RepID=A0ABV9ZM17_9PSEU